MNVLTFEQLPTFIFVFPSEDTNREFITRSFGEKNYIFTPQVSNNWKQLKYFTSGGDLKSYCFCKKDNYKIYWYANGNNNWEGWYYMFNAKDFVYYWIMF